MENGVLKNLLGITTEKELDQAEGDISYVAMHGYNKILPKKITYEHLLAIHKYILGDIYEWAGQIRVIPITKGEKVWGGDTVRYSLPDNIEKDARTAIDEMNAINWADLTNHEKAKHMAKLIARVWQSHPFREGNTRTIITFMVHFAEVHGFPMDSTLFRENPTFTRNALVVACDGQYSDFQHLIRIIEDSINNGEE
jgi:cell filamentation protein